MRQIPQLTRIVAGLALGVGTGAPTASAQALHHPTTNSSTVPAASSLPPTPLRERLDEAKRILLHQSLKNEGGEYDHPTHSDQNYAFFRAEVLEYRPRSDESDFRWDMQGWYGGDFNRLWVKSEGERNTAFKADYDIDMQLLYGRFIKKYYDFQVGVRGETQTFRGENVARAHAVIGLQGLVPYRYELESALFISQDGDVSARFQTSRDFLLTQRLILQGRFETHAAIQKVEKFTTGRGLNNIELGLRLRYEIKREIAPYIGVSYDHSFFKTADLVRERGRSPHPGSLRCRAAAVVLITSMTCHCLESFRPTPLKLFKTDLSSKNFYEYQEKPMSSHGAGSCDVDTGVGAIGCCRTLCAREGSYRRYTGGSRTLPDGGKLTFPMSAHIVLAYTS